MCHGMRGGVSHSSDKGLLAIAAVVYARLQATAVDSQRRQGGIPHVTHIAGMNLWIMAMSSSW
jgi:hypothetical protein